MKITNDRGSKLTWPFYLFPLVQYTSARQHYFLSRQDVWRLGKYVYLSEYCKSLNKLNLDDHLDKAEHTILYKEDYIQK